MKQPKKKKKRAAGGGRKKGDLTRTRSFRINDADLTAAEEKYPKKLNKMAGEWIKGLI